MSEERIKAFLSKVQDDTSLQEKLKAAADSDTVLAIAKEAGFSISAEDLTKAQSEVSDEELYGFLFAFRHVYAFWLLGHLSEAYMWHIFGT